MSDSELTRFDTIKKLDEKRLTRAQAAELLGICSQQVQRILNRYRQDGVLGLVSKKRGQPSNRLVPGFLQGIHPSSSAIKLPRFWPYVRL